MALKGLMGSKSLNLCSTIRSHSKSLDVRVSNCLSVDFWEKEKKYDKEKQTLNKQKDKSQHFPPGTTDSFFSKGEILVYFFTMPPVLGSVGIVVTLLITVLLPEPGCYRILPTSPPSHIFHKDEEERRWTISTAIPSSFWCVLQPCRSVPWPWLLACCSLPWAWQAPPLVSQGEAEGCW